MLGAATKNLGTQSIFLGDPGYRAPVRQLFFIGPTSRRMEIKPQKN